MTGLKVKEINIYITGIDIHLPEFEEEEEEEEEGEEETAQKEDEEE